MGKSKDLATLATTLNNGVNLQPNLIINGDMAVAQRGTSEASLSSFSKYPCVDRFHCEGGSSGTFTISQSSTAPEGFSNSLKFDCTTADASPSYLLISQRIEGQNLQVLGKGSANAKKTTLSFYVRSNKTGTYQVNLRDVDNTRLIGKTYTINAADTWERKSVTFDGDTTGSLGDDNGDSLRVEWWLAAGSTYNSGAVPTTWEALSNGDRAAGLNVAIGASTDDEFFITGVSLVVGDTAPVTHPYESYAENLERCNRYYWKPVSQVYLRSNGYSANGRYFGQSMAPPTIMRANPSVTLSNISYADANTAVAELTNANMLSFRAVASGDASNFAGFNIEVDAEL
jgi:hypothetical protein